MAAPVVPLIGAVRLLLIADTHVPKRARDLPARVWDEWIPPMW